MRAGIYLRISQIHHGGKDDEGRSAGIERQREDCIALAEQLGWQVVEMYEDPAFSASSGKPRPEYRRMLADIEAGRLDAVVAWHTDRLYRQLTDLEELAKICAVNKPVIRTCRVGEIDLSTPTGRLIAEILGSVAKHEVQQKADRWRRSVRQRREAGRWWNSYNRTFGYERDGALNRDEYETGRKIVQWLLDGTSLQGICRMLDDEDVVTTRGNSWDHTALRKWLRNPRIAGLSAIKDDNGMWDIIGPGQWGPIVDRETWERVLAATDPGGWGYLMAGRRPGRRAMLSELVYCGIPECGRRLYRTRKNIAVWVCRTGSRSNGHVTIAADPLEEMVEAAAREAFNDGRVRQAIAARLSQSGTTAARIVAEIDRLEGEIRELEGELRTAGDRSKSAAMRAIDEMDAQLQVQRDALSRLAPVAVPVSTDDWPEDVDRRSALIRLVVGRVVVFPAATRGGRFDSNRVRIDPTPVG